MRQNPLLLRGGPLTLALSLSGRAALISKGTKALFVVDATDGTFHLYELLVDKQKIRRTRVYHTKRHKLTMQSIPIAFAEEAHVVVTGSDHGVIYIFEREHPENVTKVHMPGKIVQAIAVGVPANFIGIMSDAPLDLSCRRGPTRPDCCCQPRQGLRRSGYGEQHVGLGSA